MFTSIDKAIVAAFPIVTYLAKSLFGIDIGVSNETFLAFVAAAVPVLVFWVPNKKWTD